MSEKSGSPRPSQVTMAGWVALVSSVLLVLSLFEAVASLNGVAFRDAVDEFLSEPPGQGLGLDTAQYVELMRQLMLISGAVAAMAAVFAAFVLQRHRGARIGLAAAAVALMLTTAPFATRPFAELLPPTVSVAVLPLTFAAILLWSRPAREWFGGRPVTKPTPNQKSSTEPFTTGPPRHRLDGRLLASERHPEEEPENEATAPWPKMPEDSSGRPVPPPTQGFGTPAGDGPRQPEQGGYPGPPPGDQGGYPAPPPAGQGAPQAQPYGQPPYGQGPQGQPPYGQQPPYSGLPWQQGAPYGGFAQGQPAYGQSPYEGRSTGPDRRPATVLAAAAVTWVLSALAILIMAVSAANLPQMRGEIVRQMQANPAFEQSGFSVDDVIALVWVMLVIMLIWAVAAIVLAWFAYRRANWARIALVVSAGLTAMFTVVGAVQSPVLLLGAAAAVAVVVLLFSKPANEWYSGGRAGASQSAGSPQSYGQPPYGQPQYGQPPYGQPPYGPSPYGQLPYGQPQYGRPPYGQPPYGPAPYGPPPYGQHPYGEPPNVEQPSYGQSQPYGAPQQYDQRFQSGPAPQSGEQPGQPTAAQQLPADQQPPAADQQSADQERHDEPERKRGKDKPPPNVW